MIRKHLIFLISLSLAFVACKESAQETVKTSMTPANAAKSAAAFEAKVRSSLGTAELRKALDEKWKNLRVGQMVRDNDRVRTAAESEVVLNNFDGTVFLISEKSDVEFNAAFRDSVRGEVNVFIRNGNIQFDVQKQKKRQYNFGTGTATASIRGTAGFVGSLDGQLVASLKEGLVDVKDIKGETSAIKENETILVTKSGESMTIKLESSGSPALFAALDSMAKAGGLKNLADLKKSLQAFDAAYVAEKNKFGENLKFEPVSLPSKVFRPSVTLKAKLTPGVYVTVMGVTDKVPESGIYERTFTWDENATGPKRFLAVCSDGSVEVKCNTWNTEYVKSGAEQAPEVAPAEKAVEPVSKAKTAPAKHAAKTAREHKNKLGLVVSLPPSEGGEILETDSLGRDTLEMIKVPSGQVLVDADLKIVLSGIDSAGVAEIDTIFILRMGHADEIITDISGTSYSRKVTFLKNEIAKYEVAAKLKDGSYVCAFKTYIVD